MKARIFLLGIVAALLSGCSVFAPGSSDFACPGMPKGVTCKTPREVYDISTGKTPKKGKAAKTGDYDPSPVEVLLVGNGGNNLEPVPVLEQAKVMRIWIAPWEDSKKDLHWPSYLFTEIHPRKWSFGKSEFTGSRPVVPHLMVRPSAQPSVPDRAESGRAGAVQPVSSPQAVTGIPEAALPQAGDALLGAQ